MKSLMPDALFYKGAHSNQSSSMATSQFPNRWDGVLRNYTQADVNKMRGSIRCASHTERADSAKPNDRRQTPFLTCPSPCCGARPAYFLLLCRIEHTLARLGAERLWALMKEEPYIHALGALSGAQAVQQIAGGEGCKV
eukprot:1144156-Pelagomonas_calceolata.AAC.6